MEYVGHKGLKVWLWESVLQNIMPVHFFKDFHSTYYVSCSVIFKLDAFVQLVSVQPSAPTRTHVTQQLGTVCVDQASQVNSVIDAFQQPTASLIVKVIFKRKLLVSANGSHQQIEWHKVILMN